MIFEIGLIAAAGVSAAIYFWLKRPTKQIAPSQTVAPLKEKPVGVWESKLGRTRSLWGEKFGKLFLNFRDTSDWEGLEEGLLAADVGMPTAQKLLNLVKGKMKDSSSVPLDSLLRIEALNLLADSQKTFLGAESTSKPFVISIVGVNGVGKTTTVGKLACYFGAQGKKVLVGAADTFRAAAIDQLKIWAERSNSQIVVGREGGDPGAVAFDALQAAQARGIDVVILDTAGRLHNKGNLMDELKKVHRVMKKVIPDAPHEIWLVVDGTLGQNSLVQAKQFHEDLGLTGIVITKLDGTSKGGIVLAIGSELGLPIRFVGLGEKVEDLAPFDGVSFVDAILPASQLN